MSDSGERAVRSIDTSLWVIMLSVGFIAGQFLTSGCERDRSLGRIAAALEAQSARKE